MDLDQLIPAGLDLENAIDLLRPLAVYVAGMAIYAVFVFNFYRFLATRDMFKIDIYQFDESRYRFFRSFFHLVMYIAKYLILFPFFAFFWFAVLTFILTFLSEGRDISDTLLIALATVSAIRFAAYYNEELARDLAKILPFALLALFLIDASYVDLGGSFEALQTAEEHIDTIVYYLGFLIALELVLRFGFGFKSWFVTKRPVRTANSGPRKDVSDTLVASEIQSHSDQSEMDEPDDTGQAPQSTQSG